MKNEEIYGRYKVQLYARVVDRHTEEKLTKDELFHCPITPGQYYYTGDVELLKKGIFQMARLRYVRHIQELINESMQMRKSLGRLDWMVQIEELACRIEPEPTEEHRKQVLAQLQGGVYGSLKATAGLRA